MKEIIEMCEGRVVGMGEKLGAKDMDVPYVLREIEYEISRWERYVQRLKDEHTILKHGPKDPEWHFERLCKHFREMRTVADNKAKEYKKSWDFAKKNMGRK